MSYKTLAMLLFLLFSFSVFSQTRILVMQDVVYPYKADQYEKAQKDMNEWIQKNVPGISWRCLQRDNYTYTYVVKLENYAKIDEMNKLWKDKMNTVDKNDFQKHADAFTGTIAHTNQFVYTKNDEGSYEAETPYIKNEDAPFRHWDYFEIVPGMEQKALEILKQEAELSKRTKMGMSYNLWRIDMGENTSSFLFASWAKSRMDYVTDGEKDDKLGGQEYKDLDKKFMSYVQKFDHWNGKSRDDLSIKAVVLSEEKK